MTDGDTHMRPETHLEGYIADMKNNSELWSQVLKEEMAIQNRLDAIDSAGDDKEEKIYEHESHPLGVMGEITASIRNRLGASGMSIPSGTIMLRVRRHARIDLGLEV